MNRRELLVRLAGACAAGAAPSALFAQADKPVTIVVPYAPGGTTDMLARVLAQELAPLTGRQYIVDNRPGAGGNIAAGFVARAPADGNTLFVASSTALAINRWLYGKLPYDPAKDFEPIGMIATVPLVVVVHPSVPVRSMAELVAYAQRSPVPLNYGSAGNGSPHHLSVEMFKAATGVKMTHVPYKGSSPAVSDLLGGQIQLMFCDIPPVLQYAQSGRLRALGVTSAKRQPTLLDIPTIAESGAPGTKGFEAVAFQSLVAPAGLAKDQLSRYAQALTAVLTRREVRARFAAEGVEPNVMSPQQLVAYIRSETERWGKVIKAAGISLD
jgi:tripartite-type tricarboxylate transporter receptor subunit TctC